MTRHAHIDVLPDTGIPVMAVVVGSVLAVLVCLLLALAKR